MAAFARNFFVVLALGVLSISIDVAEACPFCSAVGQTLSQELASMDAVVVATLIKNPPPSDPTAGPGTDIPKAIFEVTDILKGGAMVAKKDRVETIYIGKATAGSTFLIMAVGPEKLLWSTPVQLSERSQTYIRKLPSLPKDGVERLAFFQEYLEDADNLLSRDAYDEFANAPYDVVKELKGRMNHDQLIKWINDVEGIPPSRRRLYLTMLGVCGGSEDLPMLEKYISSPNRKDKGGLDALIACYLTLRGDEGLPLIEDLFLKNHKADYAETYTAIMALRFHATETQILSKQRIVKALRYMLDRPQLADLVIPDLARLEDWESADRLFELYKKSDEQTEWVRVPIVQFLRVCPEKDKADRLLKECEKIDPKSVEKAKSFLPLGNRPAAAPTADKASQATPSVPAGELRRISAEIDAGEGLAEAPQTAAPLKRKLANANLGAPPAEAAVKNPRIPPNPWALFGVPGLVGFGLIIVQWRILCGAGRS